ncbi:MAG: hypothetical protein HOP23_13420 [Methylococcaceae bacterium]|nr:hypothetical protein [Methylococcaceae bacterium]
MLEQYPDDIDYENMDDVPLFERIEWRARLVAQVVGNQHFVDWEPV